jgi:hypothetical protein
MAAAQPFPKVAFTLGMYPETAVSAALLRFGASATGTDGVACGRCGAGCGVSAGGRAGESAGSGVGSSVVVGFGVARGFGLDLGLVAGAGLSTFGFGGGGVGA